MIAGGVAVWDLCINGVVSPRWQFLVTTIAILSVVIGSTLLFQRLSAQRRRLDQSEKALRLAKEEVEQARSLAEETTRQLLEAQRIGKIGHWYTEEAAQTTTWSPQMFEFVGIPPKPALSIEEARSFVHPDDIAAFLDARRRAIAIRTTAKVENRWVRPNGEIRWMQIDLSPKYDAGGNCLGLFGTTQDLTERKQAEETLHVAQQQLVDAIESISEGFALFDREDRYVLTNSNYFNLYPGIADLCVPGTTFETVLRANVERNLHEFGPEGGDAWMRRLLEWHRASGEPMEQQLKDGPLGPGDRAVHERRWDRWHPYGHYGGQADRIRAAAAGRRPRRGPLAVDRHGYGPRRGAGCCRSGEPHQVGIPCQHVS